MLSYKLEWGKEQVGRLYRCRKVRGFQKEFGRRASMYFEIGDKQIKKITSAAKGHDKVRSLTTN